MRVFPQDTPPLVASVPYYLKFRGRLTDVRLGDLDWPLGLPKGLEEYKIADLRECDHIFSFPRSWLYGRRTKGLAAKLSILIVEPRTFHGHHMRMAALLRRRFHRILTADDKLLNSVENAQKFVFGTTWIENWQDIKVTKERMVSLIASRKNSLPGHRLRHRIVNKARAAGVELDAMGGKYLPFEEKADGLAPYRFSVVIENSIEPRYFTEKLLDAFFCETIPIYWGASEIADYFDERGMIICTTEAEIMDALKNLSAARYEAMKPYALENRRRAAPFADIHKSAARILLAS